MPLQSAVLPMLPIETARAARATYEPSSLLLLVGEHLDAILANVDFQFLYRADERVASTPALLAVMTILQFIEDWADREVAYAIRTRTDWKFAFHLPLDHLGVEEPLLGDFRKRVLRDPRGLAMFDRILNRFVTLGTAVEANRNQSNDAASIVRAVQVRNDLEIAGDTLRIAIEALTAYWPDWMRDIALPHWYERYSAQFPAFRLPRAIASRAAMLVTIENDGRYLLQAIHQRDAPALAASLTEIQRLEIVWHSELPQS